MDMAVRNSSRLNAQSPDACCSGGAEPIEGTLQLYKVFSAKSFLFYCIKDRKLEMSKVCCSEGTIGGGIEATVTMSGKTLSA